MATRTEAAVLLASRSRNTEVALAEWEFLCTADTDTCGCGKPSVIRIVNVTNDATMSICLDCIDSLEFSSVLKNILVDYRKSMPDRLCGECNLLAIPGADPFWKKVCASCFSSRSRKSRAATTTGPRQCTKCAIPIAADRPFYEKYCPTCYIASRSNNNTSVNTGVNTGVNTSVNTGVDAVTPTVDTDKLNQSRQCTQCSKYNIPATRPNWCKLCLECYKAKQSAPK
jgi:hypothetical protein